MEPGSIRIIVIGGSAGSIGPLRVIISQIPRGLGAAIFVVQHISARLPADVPSTLLGSSALPVQYAIDQERIAPGRIYVAPADKHWYWNVVECACSAAPRIRGTGPRLINVLFRSAAAAYGSSVAAVILSGMLSDGTAGLWEIKKAGGVAIVQSPAEAEYQEMPLSAVENVDVDSCLPAAKIGPLLVELVGARPRMRGE